MSWLPEAVAEVDERLRAGTCTRPTLAEHPQNMRCLGEFYDQRDEQQEEPAEPAA